MVCIKYEVNYLGIEGISYKKYFLDVVRMRGGDYENKKDAAASMMIYLIINATAPFSDIFQKFLTASCQLFQSPVSVTQTLIKTADAMTELGVVSRKAAQAPVETGRFM